MRKIGLVFLALLLFLGVYVLEGGRVTSLLVGSALMPVLVGPYLTTLFNFSTADMKSAFQDAFTDRIESDRQAIYHLDLLVIRSLNNSAIWWAAGLFMLALIGMLSSLTNAQTLGPRVAAGTVAILTAFLLRAILFIPMEGAIIRKMTILQEK